MAPAENQRLVFRDKFRSLHHEAFQAWLEELLLAFHPPGDFQAIRKTQGDGGLDGFVISSQLVYALYAPSQRNDDRDSETAAKIRSDFAKASSILSGQMKAWIFIHNHPEGKLGKLGARAISDLKGQNPSVEVSVLNIDSLWSKLSTLPAKTLGGFFGETAGSASNWLVSYALRLEAEFFKQVAQGEKLGREEITKRYMQVFVRERANVDKQIGIGESDRSRDVDGEPLLLGDVARKPGGRLLILGEGGSGKTTMLRRIALDCAREAVASMNGPLPIYVQLDFFDTQVDGFEKLFDLVARQANRERNDLYREWFDSSRRYLFLLDRLNEVRPEFASTCSAAIQQFAQQGPNHTYLVASRPGWHAKEFANQFDECTQYDIVPLGASQVIDFLNVSGAGALYEVLEGRLRTLARNPFLLWAIAKSYFHSGPERLPANLGQLYQALLDRFIFAIREESKPLEARPTRYNYEKVKKPVLARLAVDMCQEETTRSEQLQTLQAVRRWLDDIRSTGQGIWPFEAHFFMPDPPAADSLINELLDNGVLVRSGNAFEFMHESVRDYFAAVKLATLDVDAVLKVVPRLIWRHVEPTYYDLVVEGGLTQAIIMSVGLRADGVELIPRLNELHPLLAAHCLVATQQRNLELEGALVRQWLGLIEHRLPRVRWVGCQCFAISTPTSSKAAVKLETLVLEDPDSLVRSSAARALAALDEPESIKHLVAQSVERGLERAREAPIAQAFYWLRSKTAVLELLAIWAVDSKMDLRPRVIQLLSRMPEMLVRDVVQHLKDQAGWTNHPLWSPAQSVLDAIASCKKQETVIPHRGEVMERWRRRQTQFHIDRGKFESEMREWDRDQLLDAGANAREPEKRAAAVRSLSEGDFESTEQLLDAFARELDWRVTEHILEALSASRRKELLSPWSDRVRDSRNTLIFSVDTTWTSDLASGQLSQRWIDEFKLRRLSRHLVCRPWGNSNGWLIHEKSSALTNRPVNLYTVVNDSASTKIFDVGMRPRLVAVADIIGSGAIPVLEDLLKEREYFLEIAIARVLSGFIDPAGMSLLSRCVLLENNDAAKVAITSLATTRSTSAIPILLAALDRHPNEANDIAVAVLKLGGIGALVAKARSMLDGDDICRFVASTLLRCCSDKTPDVEPLLILASGDPQASVRQEATRGLGRVRSAEVQQRLVRISLEDVDEYVRGEAANAVRYSPDDVGLYRLIEAAGGLDEQTQVRAAEALSVVQDETAIPALEELVRSGGDRARVAAAEALDALRGGQDSRFFWSKDYPIAFRP